MAAESESTPFLAERERQAQYHDDEDNNDDNNKYNDNNNNNSNEINDDTDIDYDGASKQPFANAHFKRPLRLITALISFLAIGTFVTLLVTSVMLKTGNYYYSWPSERVVKNLAIVTMVTFILHTPSVFLDIPILLNMASHLAMSITIFVFAGRIFGDAWPGEHFCRQWVYDPDQGRSFPGPSPPWCLRKLETLRIMLGVESAVSMLIGLLLLSLLLMRVMALAKTQLWRTMKFRTPRALRWNPTGFTVQFTLKVIPARRESDAEAPRSGERSVSNPEASAHLIET